MSECDSELIRCLFAEKMRDGATLEEGMKESLNRFRWCIYLFCSYKRLFRYGKRYYGCKTFSFI